MVIKENDFELKISERLMDYERKKNLHEPEQTEMKQQIQKRLLMNGSPCETSDDADTLLH